MNRRSFFQSIAKAVAIVALAPQLAFRPKPLKWVVTRPKPMWQVMHAQFEARAFVFPPSLVDFAMSRKS